MSTNPWTSKGRLYDQDYKKLLALHLKSNSLRQNMGITSLWEDVEAKLLTPGQLLGFP